MQSITERMNRLERENRRLRRVVILSLVGCMAILIAGADGERVVEGERFVLKDKGGRKRAELASDETGSAGLSFYDEKGTGRMRMAIDAAQDGEPNDAAVIAISDSSGRERIALQHTFLGVSQLTISDNEGHHRLAISHNDVDDWLAFDIGDRADVLRFSIVGSDKRGVAMHFSDEGPNEPKSRLSLCAFDNEVLISLFDNAGKERVKLQVDPEGRPSVKVLDADGQPVFQSQK